MNKYIYKSFAACLAVGMALSSCSDFLEAENKSSGGNDADKYFKTDATELLTASYNDLKSLVTVVDMNENGTDMFFNTRGHLAGDFGDYALGIENSTVQSYYSNAYNAINHANGVIYYSAENSQNTYEARFIRDYCYYLLTQQFGSVPYITKYIQDAERSYPRTDLSEIYTGLITDLESLYTSSSLDAQSHVGRVSKQAVAALLSKIYLAAGWDLQTTVNSQEQGTYTVNSTEYFSKAAEYAEKAINGVSLTMSFDDKWSPNNEGNAEEIWSIQYDRASYPGNITDGGHSLQNNYGGYFGDVVGSGIKYTSSDNQPTAKMIKLFEKGDKRYEATFMTTYYNSTKQGTTADWGTSGYFAYYNLSADKLASQPIAYKYYPWYTTEAEVEADLKAHKDQFKKYDNMANENAQAARLDDANDVIVYTFDADGNFTKKTQTYAFYMEQTQAFGSVKKFDDPQSTAVTKNNDYRDIVIFHVSDEYLVAAEAYLMAGDKTASLAKLNAVRNRAGLENLSSFEAYTPEYTTSSTFQIRDIDVILDERARELYAERQRWVDLRRTKQLIRYNVEYNSYITSASQMANLKGEYKLYRPIPSKELSTNTGITSEDQNPGY